MGPAADSSAPWTAQNGHLSHWSLMPRLGRIYIPTEAHSQNLFPQHQIFPTFPSTSNFWSFGFGSQVRMSGISLMRFSPPWPPTLAAGVKSFPISANLAEIRTMHLKKDMVLGCAEYLIIKGYYLGQFKSWIPPDPFKLTCIKFRLGFPSPKLTHIRSQTVEVCLDWKTQDGSETREFEHN